MQHGSMGRLYSIPISTKQRDGNDTRSCKMRKQTEEIHV